MEKENINDENQSSEVVQDKKATVADFFIRASKEKKRQIEMGIF